jgi:hypothetical protein
MFKNDFWKEYPYFLSCLATLIFGFMAILITLFLFQEVSSTVSYNCPPIRN